jgi:hypothetical protein
VKEVRVKTLQEAARILPMLGVLQIAMALEQGHAVQVTDDQAGIVHIFEPEKEG